MSIFRSDICKVKLEDIQKIDYIYCITYRNRRTIKTIVTDTTISCNLEQRQRSSQQILDLADYLQMHSQETPIRRWKSANSFSSEIPTWVELVNPNSFFDYFKDKFESDDVMLIHDYPSNLNAIEEFSKKHKWRCTYRPNVYGSEASVTILYNLDSFYYECFTRAKTKLVIVTIDGNQR